MGTDIAKGEMIVRSFALCAEPTLRMVLTVFTIRAAMNVEHTICTTGKRVIVLGHRPDLFDP